MDPIVTTGAAGRRVEMVLPAMEAAGMEIVVARLTRALVERGHDVGITCTERLGELGASLRREGYRVCVVPTLGTRTLLFPRELATWFVQRRPEVVHVHSGAWMKAARAARMAGVPRIVHTVHGLLDREPPYDGIMKRWAARRTDAVAAVSPVLRDHLRDRIGISASNLHLLPNGVDTCIFSPEGKSLRQQLGLDSRAVVIGSVARFDPVKNHMLLLDVFTTVARTHADAQLLLAGDGPLRPQVENEVERRGLTNRVLFLGPVSDTSHVYRTCDIYVCSSNAEGTSMSILEAMATAVPVVATAVGGNPAVLEGGRAGVLVPPRDVATMADAVLELISRPAERGRIGSYARERVSASYSQDAMIAAYEKLYFFHNP